MAKKKAKQTNELKKKCPQCKVPMQEYSSSVKGFVRTDIHKCTRCGQRDVSETTDEVKD